MHCEDAKKLLFDYAERRLSDDLHAQVSQALEECEECQELYHDIQSMQQLAATWQEQPTPEWQRPGNSLSHPALSWFLWIPSLTSFAALAMVSWMFFSTPTSTSGYLDAPKLVTSAPVFDQPSVELVDDVLNTAKNQRQQELQALVTILKAEMDRRSLETEESLRYVVAHQIQGQQEIEDLYQRIRTINYQPTNSLQ